MPRANLEKKDRAHSPLPHHGGELLPFCHRNSAVDVLAPRTKKKDETRRRKQISRDNLVISLLFPSLRVPELDCFLSSWSTSTSARLSRSPIPSFRPQDAWYGSPPSPQTPRTKLITTQLTAPYSTGDKTSFGWVTARERWPVIIVRLCHPS